MSRCILFLALLAPFAAAQKHIVVVAADQEYRSEESLPPFARILAERNGFRTTMLHGRNAAGEIDAAASNNIPGLEALDRADLLVMLMRFQELPDGQMKHFVDYFEAGKPIVALRTSTHAFNYRKDSASAYAKYGWNNKELPGGFGRQVLGETWIAHYGAHQKESTRGVVAPGMEQHPILRGVRDVWGPSDVYAVTTLNGDAQPLLLGEVLAGMTPDAPPNKEKKLTPVAWTKTYKGGRIFTTTMGHPGDFQNEGFRRMVVNACYWALGLEPPAAADVRFFGEFKPGAIGFRRAK